MRRNMGKLDRIGRAFVVAPLLIVTAFAIVGPGSALGITALVVAGVMLATAAAGFCPLYTLLGISTCPAGARTARRARAVMQQH